MAINFATGPALSSQRIEDSVNRKLDPLGRSKQFSAQVTKNSKLGKPVNQAPTVTSKQHKFKPVASPTNRASFDDKILNERITSATVAANEQTQGEIRKREKYQQQLAAWDFQQQQKKIKELEAANRQLDKAGQGVSFEGTGPSADGTLVPIAKQTGNAVVDAALSMVGTQYSYGGGGYDKRTSYGTARGDQNVIGVDCSGLTSYAYYQAGITIPRHSVSQTQAGHKTSIKNAQPGDIVGWYNSDGSIMKHVAIYAGNGMIIEANSYTGQVSHRPLWSSGSAFAVRIG